MKSLEIQCSIHFILFRLQYLLSSISSIYYDQQHPPCLVLKSDSVFLQPLSTFPMTYIQIIHLALHNPCLFYQNILIRKLSLHEIYRMGQNGRLEWSLTPHSTQYRSFRRWSSQPITWLILTNKTVQENTDKETQYKSEKVNNLKYSKTKLPWFSCLLQHSARKWGGLILQPSRAHTGQWAKKTRPRTNGHKSVKS